MYVLKKATHLFNIIFSSALIIAYIHSSLHELLKEAK